MCGINVIIYENANMQDAFLNQHNVMAQTTKHRGVPEGYNEKITLEGCILGANRLPITSNAEEKQPMFNEEKTIAAVLNGEIYNYKELRESLRKKGHKFTTGSDTEVLVHMYEEHGMEMAKFLDGMFAFVVYDLKSRKYLAARDPIGIKPLYYSQGEGVLHISSEIKGLSKLDVSEIKYLAPGHYLTDGVERRYFSLEKYAVPEDKDSIVSDLRILIDAAVKKRVDTNLPVCVFFSGGIDSATVLSTARKYHPNVTAITFGVEGSPDREVAERYCRENSIPLLIAHPWGLEQLTSEFVRIAETFDPNIIRHMVGNYTVSKVAKENGFRIALVGESADELFGGYGVFKEVDHNLVTRISEMLIGDLHRTQLQRVDRAAMSWTIEARVPFLDIDLLQYGLGIPNTLKVFDDSGTIIEKWVFREAMRDRLPDYITSRRKLPFSTGGGLDTDNPNGAFSRIAEKIISDKVLRDYQSRFPEFDLRTKEEVMYFTTFEREGYLKAKFNTNRIGTARDETKKRILDPNAELPEGWNTQGN